MKKIIFLLFTTFSFAQSITKTVNLLPDTGQNLSYTTIFGEDNDYTINSPSYTDNGDGTITDIITGLMWQKYDGGEMTIENASTYCDNLTLANYTNWRLPSPMEAYSILNLQNANPAINTTYFPNTTAEYWWTNTYQAGDNTKVWVTNAGGGIGNHPKSETFSAGGTKKFHVRAVRDVNATSQINHFTDNGDGTITDNRTQLVWQKNPSTTTMTWEQALIYSESLSLANTSDWRLPNIKELQSLNDESISNPSVNVSYFTTIGVKNYWSSTTLKPNSANPSSAWYFSTQFGITTYDLKANSNYVLCVRGIPATLAVSSIDSKSKIKVFPNPFSSKINIENQTGNETYILYDNSGKQLFSGKKIENEDFTSLSKGIYFLEIKSEVLLKFKLIKK
jgi:hypothetical protein